MSAVTQWFDVKTRPAQPGVYERKPHWKLGRRFAYWDGFFWRIWSDTPQSALLNHGRSTHDGSWRGLAVKP